MLFFLSENMKSNKRVDDTYTNQARKEWYVARSVYKLEEIDKKYGLLHDQVRVVVDVGAAPGSRLQYLSHRLAERPGANIIGFDIKPIQISLPAVTTYLQDITDREGVKQALAASAVIPWEVDMLVSDMAPDTIGMSDIDAMRSIWLVEKILWMCDELVRDDGSCVIKVFMWPWFDELVRHCKQTRWTKRVVVYKPKACRPGSKETYIVRRPG